MKITRRQLKRIIRETRSPNDMAPQIMQDQEDKELMDQYSDIDDYFDGGYDEEDREWIVYSELSGRFEPSGIRDPSELGKIKAYINVNGQAARQHYGSQMAASMMENRMKITRRQLRKIIKETLITEAGRFSSRMPKYSPWAEVATFFEELGGGMWKYKLTSNGATFQLPDHRGEDFGYFVLVEYNRGTYKMRWIQRVPTSENPYVKVIRPRNGWEVESIDRDIKNAVDEIMYDIATHEAEPENWSPGAGNAN